MGLRAAPQTPVPMGPPSRTMESWSPEMTTERVLTDSLTLSAPAMTLEPRSAPQHAGMTMQAPGSRTSSYQYDGLGRLEQEQVSGGDTTSYGYDRVGNRTSRTVNGATENYSYNAANQRTGWTYDAAGNLLSDGSRSYTYDALNRLISAEGSSYTYNGDGVLVAEQGSGNPHTTYAQDLAAPLPQVLSDGTTTYLYGHTRLLRRNAGGRAWYLADALGSVRQLLSDAGTPRVVWEQQYTAFGTPTAGTLPERVGFTGELHSGDLLYLRARWYDPASGTFTSVDPFDGFDTHPYSLHPYQYGYSDPVRWTDASGEHPVVLIIGGVVVLFLVVDYLDSPATVYAPNLEAAAAHTAQPAAPSVLTEADKDFLISAPATGDMHDPIVLLTGQDVFGRDQSRLAALLATCLPFVTMRMLRMADTGAGSGGSGLVPGSGAHKRQRWEEYQAGGGQWNYERWSKVYDLNMTRAIDANAAVDAYHNQLDWGHREVTLTVDGTPRRLDIVDTRSQRAIEYKTGYQVADQENLSELERDAKLVSWGWDIKWVFEGKASQPLLDALKSQGISYEILAVGS